MVFPRQLLNVLSGALCVALLAAACGSREPLSHAAATPEDLATRVLQAVEDRNTDALVRLALDEREFRDHVWPSLPASRPERNLPFGYVWGDLYQKSRQGMASVLAEHAGNHYRFVRLRALGGTTAYAHFVVHREVEVTVKDAEGREMPVRLFCSILEKSGAFKVFSFVVDD